MHDRPPWRLSRTVATAEVNLHALQLKTEAACGRRGGIGMMGGSGCITCHAPDGRGGTVTMMMSRFDVPDTRWSTLSQPMQSPEGDMEPPYDPTVATRRDRL